MTVTPVGVSPGVGWSVNCGPGAGSAGSLSKSALYPTSAGVSCTQLLRVSLKLPGPRSGRPLHKVGSHKREITCSLSFFSRSTASPTVMGLSLA